MTVAATVLISLGAAATFAIAAVLQQLAARTVPRRDSMRLALLLRLIRKPLWLAGSAGMLVGYGLQALALSIGPVALVQPITVTELAFAIPFAMWLDHTRPRAREWLGLTGIIVGVSLFLLGSSPSPGSSNPPFTVWIWVLAPAGSLVALVLFAASTARGRARALLLGTAAGVCFGLIAVLTKTTTHLLGEGISVAATQWEPYVLMGTGILALVCSQSAYQAAPLAYSMPVHDLLEPSVAVIVGMTALKESVPLDAASIGISAVGAMMACAGIVALSTSPIVHGMYLHQNHDPSMKDRPTPPDPRHLLTPR